MAILVAKTLVLILSVCVGRTSNVYYACCLFRHSFQSAVSVGIQYFFSLSLLNVTGICLHSFVLRLSHSSLLCSALSFTKYTICSPLMSAFLAMFTLSLRTNFISACSTQNHTPKTTKTGAIISPKHCILVSI